MRVRLPGLGQTRRWLSARGPEPGEWQLDGRAALRALRSSGVDLRSVHALLTRAGLLSPRARGRYELERALELALSRAQLVVLEARREPLDFEGVVPAQPRPELDDAPAAIEEPEPRPSPALAVELIVIEAGTQGARVPGLTLALVDTSGRAHEGRSDAGGGLRFVPVSPGSCTFELLELDEFVWSERPEQAPAPIPAESARVELRLSLREHGGPGARAGGSVEAESSTLVELARPLIYRPQPQLTHFDHDGALLVPGPWTEDRHPLAAVVHALVALLQYPERELLVVGRASASGSTGHNQRLSEDRAAGLRALLEDDTNAWVELAKAEARSRELCAYFDYLARRRGWSCLSPAPIEELGEDPPANMGACIEAFQSDYNARFEGSLALDGVCGRKTLGAMFEVLHDELERWLSKLGVRVEELPADRIHYLSCGAARAGAGGEGAEAERGDRVLDLFLIEGEESPEQLELERIYSSPLPRRVPLPLPHEPDEWATGPFTIVTDLNEHEEFEPETYRLQSEDERVRLELVVPNDATIEAGEHVLHYPALPTDTRYSLTVIAAGGDESEIFTGLSYAELHTGPQPEPREEA